MDVLLIEDEAPAAEGLIRLLHRANPALRVVGQLDSVEETVRWLAHHPPPALVLLDVQLADGLCFEIFAQTTIPCPIIFTTAYDTYALQAFQVLSIDYLLKPIALPDLQRALGKWQWLRTRGDEARPAGVGAGPAHAPAPAPGPDLAQLAGLFEQLRTRYKSRFLVRWNGRMQFRPADEIAYFHAEGHAVYLVSTDGRSCLVDYTLDQLDELLDPHLFFRPSRKFTVRLTAVRDIRPYPGSRLRLLLEPLTAAAAEVLVSRERVAAFKVWLDQ